MIEKHNHSLFVIIGDAAYSVELPIAVIPAEDRVAFASALQTIIF